jgi:hypothetical protein
MVDTFSMLFGIVMGLMLAFVLGVLWAIWVSYADACRERQDAWLATCRRIEEERQQRQWRPESVRKPDGGPFVVPKGVANVQIVQLRRGKGPGAA